MTNKFMDKIREKNIPITMFIELTHRCNIKCRYCFQKEAVEEEFGLDRWKLALDQLREADTLHLIFTGGEPMAHPDFWEIAEYAVEQQFVCSLMTNGITIGANEAKRLRELKFYYVKMSLHGANDETHDWMTGMKGSYEKLMRATEFLRAEDILVEFSVTLTRRNYHELDAMWEIMRKYEMRPLVSPVVTPSKKGSDLGHLRLDDSQISGYLKWFNEVKPANGLVRDCGPDSLLCGTGKSTGAMTPTGDAIPCPTLAMPAGNILEKPFKEIWKDSPVLQKIRAMSLSKIDECRVCGLSGGCVKCAGYGYLETGNYPFMSSELCRFARLKSAVK